MEKHILGQDKILRKNLIEFSSQSHLNDIENDVLKFYFKIPHFCIERDLCRRTTQFANSYKLNSYFNGGL